MKKGDILFILICLTQLGYSQSLQFGPKHKTSEIKGGIVEQAVTDSNGFSYLLLTYDTEYMNNNIGIAKFNKGLKLLEHAYLTFENTRMNIKRSFVFNNMIYVHTSLLNYGMLIPAAEYYYAEYLVIFDLNGKYKKQTELIKITKNLGSSNDYISSITMLPNQESFFYVIYNKSYSPIDVTYKAYDGLFKEFWSYNIEYDYKYKVFKKHEPSVIGDNLIVLLEIEKHKKERVKGENYNNFIVYIQPINSANKILKSLELQYDKYVSQLQVVRGLNELEEEVEIYGTYNIPYASKGIVITTLSIANLTYNSKYTEIASKVVDQLPDSRKVYKKRDGIEHYDIMNIGIIDEHYFLILEKNLNQTGSSMFSNYSVSPMGAGGPGMTIYYTGGGEVSGFSGEIIVLKFNNKREMEWFKVIPKRQTVYAYQRNDMLSHRMLASKDNLYFVYQIIESDKDLESGTDDLSADVDECKMKITKLTPDGKLSSIYLTPHTDQDIKDKKLLYTYIQKGSKNIFYATSGRISFRLIKLNRR
ncbi:MAG: hypothetical protein JKX95_02110 [Bacteroidia bacterium]|nr:hypothetical protein [Bacteroidia bacterium]